MLNVVVDWKPDIKAQSVIDRLLSIRSEDALFTLMLARYAGNEVCIYCLKSLEK